MKREETKRIWTTNYEKREERRRRDTYIFLNTHTRLDFYFCSQISKNKSYTTTTDNNNSDVYSNWTKAYTQYSNGERGFISYLPLI